MEDSLIIEKIQTRLKECALDHYGWAPLQRPLSIDLYKDWIQRGEQGDMGYLEQHALSKENPRRFRQAQSAIVLGIPYFPHPWTLQKKLHNTTALYAQGRDYHHEIPKMLSALLESLRKDFPSEEFETFTDSAPILERDLAYRAGLGWIGKNTCMIHPKKGSLFWIAEIYTTLSLTNTNPWSSDFCGQCNRCIEACPTQALQPDRRMQASRCISYLTIEAKTIPTEDLRSSIGDWLFGCDICQTVCPWNQKHLKTRALELNDDPTELRVQELKWILTSSRKSLSRELQETPLARTAGWKLQRNALIVAANNGYVSLIPDIEPWQDDPKLGELAQWALSQLSPTC